MITMLLAAVGVGHFDAETFEWTPTSDIVYSFDVEVFDIDRMYTLFLQGIQSISGDEFEITQIREEARECSFYVMEKSVLTWRR